MMNHRRFLIFAAFGSLLLCGWGLPNLANAQQAPPASGARMLIVPRQIVSGERATLAVLDVNGRLTPGVNVNFSNGDKLTTDTTGRALFVAPLNPGVIFASIAGRAGRIPTVILTPTEAATSSIEVSKAPRVASLADRFEISGRGFCGGADTNQVTIAGQPALVLASSPTSLVVLPPTEMEPGPASLEISCGKHTAAPFSILFLSLELEADSSPLSAGQHRALTVRVSGTAGKVTMEARNLAPDVAELIGGNVTRQASSGGATNTARFEVVGHKHGNFVISIRLLSNPQPVQPVTH